MAQYPGVARRKSWDNSGIFVEVRFGAFRLHPTEGLRRGSRELHVTPKALSVLCFLTSHPGKVVGKDDLIRAVWREIAVSDSALTSCIKELRRALKDDAKRPRFIETLNRRGYRFIADLSAATDVVSTATTRASDAQYDSLVGRDETLDRLSGALVYALDGHRQVIFVAGEPGIGKTSLVKAFMRDVERRSGEWRITHGQCVEHYGACEPYQPLLDAMRRLCRGADAEPFLAALRQYAPSWLAQLPALQEPAEFRVLERRTAGITPERMRRELVDALEVMTSHAPIVLCLEDVHWSDLSTLDWITTLAARSERARLVLIATCRTADVRAERHPLRAMTDSLRVKRLCQEILLAGLTDTNVCAYIAARFPAMPGALDHLGQLVHRHTEGNPLFVMNVLADLVARGVLSEQDGRWSAAQSVDAVSFGIPEDVRLTISRQLERLTSVERELLEVMSLMSGSCAAAAIAAGADVPTADVEATLGALAREHWFVGDHTRAEWPDGTVSASFEFLHSLYRDVLSSRVQPARRIGLHRRIGERLERGHGARAAEIAAELALHFEEAREPFRAVVHLQHAAETSRRRSAYSIAEGQLRHALDVLEQVPPSAERTEREAGLRIAIGSVLMAVRGWGSDEVETHYSRALDLCRELGSTAFLFPSLWGLWLFQWGRGNERTAGDLVVQLRGHARESLDPAHKLQACHAAWATSFSLGNLDDARQQAAEGTVLYQVEQHASLASAYGNHDAGICALNFSARALVLLGAVDEAVRVSEASIARARELNHPFSLAQTLFFAATVHHARQDPQATLTRASAAVAMAREHGFRLLAAWASIFEGWSLVETGRVDEGLAILREAVRAATSGAAQFTTHFHGVVAEACLACGHHDEGLKAVGEGLRLTERMDERFYESELYRLRGELRLAVDSADGATDAEDDFRRALAVARQQNARRLFLRAAASLARAGRNPLDERRQLLEGACRGISEGIDLPDMRAASHLLDQLRSGDSHAAPRE